MSSITKLKGLVTLVAGGARGLGRGTVERFVQQGAKVVICDLPDSKGLSLAKKLATDAVVFAPCDITKESEVEAAMGVAEEKFGRLDVAVTTAAIGVAKGIFNKTDGSLLQMETFDKLIQVNTVGTFNIARFAAKTMGKNEPNEGGQRGVIINTASISALEGQNGTSAYSASKGAVVSMTLPMSRDLASLGIRVNTIAPGFFDSVFFEGLADRSYEFVKFTIPFPPRFGQADEFAHMVQFIIENPDVNGEVIRIDGATRLFHG